MGVTSSLENKLHCILYRVLLPEKLSRRYAISGFVIKLDVSVNPALAQITCNEHELRIIL